MYMEPRVTFSNSCHPMSPPNRRALRYQGPRVVLLVTPVLEESKERQAKPQPSNMDPPKSCSRPGVGLSLPAHAHI